MPFTPPRERPPGPGGRRREPGGAGSSCLPDLAPATAYARPFRAGSFSTLGSASSRPGIHLARQYGSGILPGSPLVGCAAMGGRPGAPPPASWEFLLRGVDTGSSVHEVGGHPLEPPAKHLCGARRTGVKPGGTSRRRTRQGAVGSRRSGGCRLPGIARHRGDGPGTRCLPSGCGGREATGAVAVSGCRWAWFRRRPGPCPPARPGPRRGR